MDENDFKIFLGFKIFNNTDSTLEDSYFKVTVIHIVWNDNKRSSSIDKVSKYNKLH